MIVTTIIPSRQDRLVPNGVNGMTDVKDVAERFYRTVDEIAAGTAPMSAFQAVAAPDFRAHLPGNGTVDRAGFQAVLEAFAVGFSGARHDVADVVAEGEKVAVRMTWHAQHTGEFQGAAATGNTIAMAEVGIMRIIDGAVLEFWPLFDSATLVAATTTPTAGAGNGS